MTSETLQLLATKAGIAAAWTDVFGEHHTVSAPTLRAILAALDLPADTEATAQDSLAGLSALQGNLPPLTTGVVGRDVVIPCPPARYQLLLEDGRSFDGFSRESAGGSVIPPVLEPGYHLLTYGDRETLLAIAPVSCFTVPEALRNRRGWGVAVQVYALRSAGDCGIGDLKALAEFVGNAARHGADAVAISPLHAQFSADPDRFSPYAPSSRTALNVLHASIDNGATLPAQALQLEGRDLVDWPAASRIRLEHFRAMFDGFIEQPESAALLNAFRAGRGKTLEAHALFEALHGHFFKSDVNLWHWRTWPEPYRDPHSAEVAAFAATHAQEVSFHAYLQFLADRGLAHAQKTARESGMGIGLISDLAVGTDSGGSQCWSRQQETLLGLTIGAPPDLLQRKGQNWGLTAFSPRGLVQNGFLTYREMLATALAHAGGMRIDHAMGLNRLWVIPEGADGADGAFLSFPEQDLLRLVTLESHRHRAVVLAEDLGTVPEGFTERLREAGIDGMRVLWFERDKDQHFTTPTHWTSRAAAMTSTHDLPTVAGWWKGRDIEWREQLGHIVSGDEERSVRSRDRRLLWDAMRTSGAAQGDPPELDDADKAADAACVHVGRSACELVMLPVEDALALVEQPNLPGTLNEHPNWRRRLPGNAARLLDERATAARLAALDKARQEQE